MRLPLLELFKPARRGEQLKALHPEACQRFVRLGRDARFWHDAALRHWVRD